MAASGHPSRESIPGSGFRGERQVDERIRSLCRPEAVIQERGPALPRAKRAIRQNGVFRDATEQSGISGSALTYGLGAGITDVNNDGWEDIYVNNGFFTTPDTGDL